MNTLSYIWVQISDNYRTASGRQLTLRLAANPGLRPVLDDVLQFLIAAPITLSLTLI